MGNVTWFTTMHYGDFVDSNRGIHMD
eukprot:SAG22_NODE_16474_length_324_cov_1.022222_2_plen_25_part_01